MEVWLWFDVMLGSVHRGTDLRWNVSFPDSREDDERSHQPHPTTLHQNGRRQQSRRYTQIILSV